MDFDPFEGVRKVLDQRGTEYVYRVTPALRPGLIPSVDPERPEAQILISSVLRLACPDRERDGLLTVAVVKPQSAGKRYVRALLEDLTGPRLAAWLADTIDDPEIDQPEWLVRAEDAGLTVWEDGGPWLYTEGALKVLRSKQAQP